MEMRALIVALVSKYEFSFASVEQSERFEEGVREHFVITPAKLELKFRRRE